MPIFNNSNKNKSLELLGVTLIPIVKHYFSYIEHTTVDLQRQDLSIDTLFVAFERKPESNRRIYFGFALDETTQGVR